MYEVKEWKHPSNYLGATWEGWFSAGFGQSRDSDALEQSNFQVAYDELKKLSTEFPLELEKELQMSSSVEIIRENHWAVGWVEWIAIHGSNPTALDKARELCKSANDYPVLNENHFSELEMNQANEVWKGCYNTSKRIKYIREHRSQFEFNSFADMLGCVRGKYFAGYASELLS